MSSVVVIVATIVMIVVVVVVVVVVVLQYHESEKETENTQTKKWMKAPKIKIPYFAFPNLGNKFSPIIADVWNHQNCKIVHGGTK